MSILIVYKDIYIYIYIFILVTALSLMCLLLLFWIIMNKPTVRENIVLQRIFRDPANPASFSSLEKLFQAGRANGLTNLTRDKVRYFLSAERSYTLHYPVRLHGKRDRILTYHIDDLHQIDVAFFTHLSAENDGYPYALFHIDTFSKQLWVTPLKTKSGAEVAAAIEKVFVDRSPNLCQTDKGLEFRNPHVRRVMQRYRVKHYYTESASFHCAIVERSIRTIKSRLYKYFTQRQTFRWIDVIERVVSAYNSTWHRSIGMAPNQVTQANVPQVLSKLFPTGTLPHEKVKFKFRRGAKVRLKRDRGIFGRGFDWTYTDEVFQIVRVEPGKKVAKYYLQDFRREPIQGVFYDWELVEVH